MEKNPRDKVRWFQPPTPAFLSSIILFFLGCPGYAGGTIFRLTFFLRNLSSDLVVVGMGPYYYR